MAASALKVGMKAKGAGCLHRDESPRGVSGPPVCMRKYPHLSWTSFRVSREKQAQLV